MTADPKKAARAALYVARKTFAPGGATDDDAFTAYHGTPHEFESEPDAPYGRFRDTAIGSGEGAQAFGYGHYLAGNEGIAKSYRDALRSRAADKEYMSSVRSALASLTQNEQKTYDDALIQSLFSKEKTQLPKEPMGPDALPNFQAAARIFSAYNTKDLPIDVAKQIQAQFSHLRDEESFLQNGPKALAIADQVQKMRDRTKGHLLETRVRAKPEHFLDWDKPLSEQHPHVQNALQNIGVPLKSNLTGEKAYNHVVGEQLLERNVLQKMLQDKKAIGDDRPFMEIHDKLKLLENPHASGAKSLADAGIPGIRYLDANSRGPTGAPTHNYVVFDPKNIDIVRRYAQGGEVYSNHAPRHTMQSPAVAELKHLLTMHRDELRSMKGRTQYAAIDGIMKRISHEHGIAPSKLHDDWMSVYHQTPDAWVAGDHGNIVDRALKMTSRGGYAFGGSPAGAPINFAPAAGAFTGLPLPKGSDIAPSKATLAAILASRPTTYTGSSKPLESKYIGPSIAAPTFNASAYNLPDNPLEEGQGGSGDRWHPNGGGAPTGGTAEMAAAAAAAAGPLGGGYGDSDAAAARGGRIHRANDDRVQHALSLTRHAALPGRQHTRGRP